MTGLLIGSYDLHMDVDFKKGLVNGTVRIGLESDSRDVILDAVDMDIKSVRSEGADLKFRFDRKAGALRVSGVPRRATVDISYAKRVAEDAIIGLYKSRYGSKYMLVTDLEPAEARKVFPCKDDPSHKAVIKLEVVTDCGLSVISNSELKSTEATPDGRSRHVFYPTPKMSTYLFFLGVGDFEEASLQAGGPRVIAATRPNQIHRSDFILGVASRVLEDYSAYFGVPYPLKKLHLVALPEYHTGAMENWGAITSREAYVLVDEGSGVGPSIHAALVMTHEIAHQWFGDLVTMKWWNDLWLNESFATFMAYKMVDRLKPEWAVWTDFIRTESFRSMNQDAFNSTHPIEVNVKTTDEIGQVFDAISYGKGASVIRMVESFVGEVAFRKGVSAYLKAFGYSNAVGKDLWTSLEKYSGKPVSKLMSEWVRKPGYPLVEVSSKSGVLSFNQRRFSLSSKSTKGLWPIPISYTLDGQPRSLFLDRRTKSVRARETSALLVNPKHTGFYSVLYDGPGYEKLAERFGSLDQYDKGGIMNDLYLFLQAGIVSPDLYRRFVSLCGNISDHLVVMSVTDQLVALNTIAGDSKRLGELARVFLKPQIGRLGTQSPGMADGMANDEREAVATALAMVDEGFAARLAGRFGDYRAVGPEMKTAVAISYARSTGLGAFETLETMAKREDSELERSRIYRGMTAFKEPELVERTLELAVSGQVSRSDTAYTLGGAGLNPLAYDTLWRWIQRRYQRLWELYGGSQAVFSMLDVILPRCGLGHEQEVMRFLAGKIRKHGGITFNRTLEKLAINSNLRRRMLES